MVNADFKRINLLNLLIKLISWLVSLSIFYLVILAENSARSNDGAVLKCVIIIRK